MAKKINYYFSSASFLNSTFIDFDLNYGSGSITASDQEIVYSGTTQNDSIFVRPGLTYDLSKTSTGIDKIYLSGNFSEYELKTVLGSSTVRQLERTVNSKTEIVIFSIGTPTASDTLVFADGSISTDEIVKVSPSLNPNEKSTDATVGTGNYKGAVINASSSYVPPTVDTKGVTFAAVPPGVVLNVSGTKGVDTVYVGQGSTVVATGLGPGQDLIYLRGNWADYSKKTSGPSTLILTRTVGTNTESVTVSCSVSDPDKLIFADGSIDSDIAYRNRASPNPGLDATEKTPLLSDLHLQALSKIKNYADDNGINTGTNPAPTAADYANIGVTGLTGAGNTSGQSDADLLATLNRLLATTGTNGITSAQVDTTGEVQAIVSGYSRVLAAADGTDNNTAASAKPTAADYAALGITGFTSGTNPAPVTKATFLDDVIDGKIKTQVDDQSELQTLADAVSNVLGYTSTTTTNIPTADQINALLPAPAAGQSAPVTAANLAAVLGAIAAANGNGTLPDQAALNTIVSNVLTLPTLKANILSVDYGNNMAWQSLFGGAVVSTGTGPNEPSQTITGLTFTVAGIDGTDNEKISVGGTEFILKSGIGGTTTSNVRYDVTVNNGTATVTLSGVSLTPAQTQTLVESILYRYAAKDGMQGNHVVTLTGITDSGPAGNNTSALNLVSTVKDVTQPVLTMTSDVSQLQSTQTATITFKFSENIGTSFTLNDLVVTGGALANLSQPTKNADGTYQYTATFTPSISAGDATIAVKPSVYYDTASNVGLAVNPVRLGISSARPVTINTIAGDDTVTSSEVFQGVSISGTCATDATDVQVVVLSASGTRLSKTASITNGIWTTTTPFTAAEMAILSSTGSTSNATVFVRQTVAGTVSSEVAKTFSVDSSVVPFTDIQFKISSNAFDPIAGDDIISGADTLPSISGTATPNATVTVVLTNTVTGRIVTLTTVTPANGNWTTAALTEAQRTDLRGDFQPLLVTATQSITVNNTTQSSSTSRTITIDTQAPDAPSAPRLVADTDGVASDTAAADNITSVQTPTFSGKANPGAIVKLYLSGSTLIGTGTADPATGVWTIKSNQQLTATTHTITVKQTDAAGNEGAASSALNVTVDIAAPVPTINSLTSPGAQPVISGTAEAGATVEIYYTVTGGAASLKGTVKADSSGNWSFQATDIITGNQSITAKQIDIAGNPSATSLPMTFTVSASQLGTPFLDSSSDSGTLGDGITSTATPTLKGSGVTVGATVQVWDSGTLLGTTIADGNGTWTFTPSTPLIGSAAGTPHSITVKQLDATGQTVVKTSTALSLKVDTSAAALGITTPVATNFNVAPTLTGTGAEANATITLNARATDGSTQTFTAKANASGNWTIDTGSTVNSQTQTALVSNKIWTFSATQTDVAGNTSPVSVAKTVNYDASISTPTISKINAVDVSNNSTHSTANRVTLAGTAEASNVLGNVTVKVYDGTTFLGSTTTDAMGGWTFTTSALSLGSHTLNVAQVDAAGNVSSQVSKNITVSDVLSAPVLLAGKDTGILGDGITSSQAPTLLGQATAGSKVEIWDTVNGVDIKLATVIADNAGSWSTSLSNQAEGVHSYVAKQIGNDGAVISSSAATTLTIDISAPGATSAPEIKGASDLGLSGDNRTNINTPTLTGKADANAWVSVFQANSQVAIGKVQANANGVWNFTVPSAVADGTVTFTTKQEDAAGNLSAASSALSLTIDTTASAPVITALSLPGAQPVISGTGAEAGATVEIFNTVNSTTTSLGTVKANSSGAWSFTATTITSGSHSITAKQTDIAGNVSPTSAAMRFSVDSAAMSLPALQDASDSGFKGDGVTNITTPTFTGVSWSKVSGTSIEIWDDDGTGNKRLGTTTTIDGGVWTYTPSSNLSAGAHRITAKDPSASKTSAVFNLTVDTSAAAPVVAAPTDVNVKVPPTLTGTAEANATINLTARATDGTTKTFSTTANGNGAWTFDTASMASPLAANKIWTFSAQQTDAAGNISAVGVAQTVNYDTAISTPTITNLADNATTGTKVTLTGTAEASNVLGKVTVKVYDGTTFLGSTTTDFMGGWTFTTSALNSGAHTLKVEQVDAAGNLSSQLSKAITVSTTALSAPVLNSYDGVSFTGNFNTAASVTAADGYGVSGWFKLDSLAGGYQMISQSSALGEFAVRDGLLTYWNGARDANNNIVPNPTLPTLPNTAWRQWALMANAGTVSIYLDGVLIGTKVGVSTDAAISLGMNIGRASGSGDFSGTMRDIRFWDVALSNDQMQSLFSGQDTGAESSIKAAYPMLGNISASIGNNFTVNPAWVPSLSDTGIAGDNITSSTAPVLLGQAAAGATVEIWDTLSGVTSKRATVIADSSGKWMANLSSQAEGVHNYFVKELDGNAVVRTSTATQITIDTTPPSSAPQALTLLSDNGATDNLTNINTPILSGTADAKAWVTVFQAGTAVGKVQADTGGAWSFTVPKAVADGTYAFTAKQEDVAGNLSAASSALNVTVDTTVAAPSLARITLADTFDSNANGWSNLVTISGGKANATSATNILVNNSVSLTVGATYTLSFDYVKTSGLRIRFNNNSTGNGNFINGETLVTPNLDASGKCVFTFVAKQNGFVIAADGLGFTGSIDNLVLYEEGTETPYSANPMLKGVAEPGATVYLYDNGSPSSVGTAVANATGVWTFDGSNLLAGPHSFTAKQTDRAGNISPLSRTYAFTVDRTLFSAPALEVGSDTGVKGDGLTSVLKPGFKGSGLPAGTTLKLFDGAASTTELAGNLTFDSDANTGLRNWSFNFDANATNLTVGNHSIIAKVFSGGTLQSTSAPLSLTIDTTAPSVPTLVLGDGVSDVTNRAEALQGSGVVKVNADSGSKVTVTFTNGANTVIKTLIGTGAVQAVVLSGSELDTLSNGTITVTAIAKDDADNASNPASSTFVLDAAVPLAPTVITLQALGGNVESNAFNSTNTSLNFSALINAGEATNGRAEFYVNGNLVGTDSSIASNDTSVTLSASAAQLSNIGAGGQVSVKLYDASGNSVLSNGPSLLNDLVAPTLSATTAPYISTGASSVSLTVTFDSPVKGLTSGTSNAILTVGNTFVSAQWSGTDGDNFRTLTYNNAGQQVGVDETALKAALTAAIKDVAGNAFSYSGVINTIDSTPQVSFGALNGVANLDVTSNLVFNSDRPLKFGSTGSIHIYENNSGQGFHNDINDNDQTINVATAIEQKLISFSTDRKSVIINPQWDLDLSSNYSISIDPGFFVTEQGNNPTAALGATFSTVTPGTTGSVSANAASSKIMTDLGTLVDSKKWFDFENVGADATNLVGLGDLKGGAYALVMKNYATDPLGSSDGIDSAPFQVKFTNFGQDDVIYIDSQANNATQQSYQPNKTSVYYSDSLESFLLEFSKSGSFSEGIALPRIGLTLEGLTDNSKYFEYGAINTYVYSDGATNTTFKGFADEWHNKSQAVLMA